MDNEKLAEQTADDDLERDEAEYEIEGMETEDLDDAMRDALEAVERRQEELKQAASTGEGDADGAEVVGDLTDLEAELAELRARSVRTLADFDNYRKRVARERQDERRYAAADLAQDILAVVDNLERALDSEGSAEDLKQGVGMIHKQLEATLRRHGVERVMALGEPFDPTLHEAVMRVEDSAVEEPRVREELQTGYTLHDRLLRPSMVKVAVPQEEAAQDGDAEEPEAE